MINQITNAVSKFQRAAHKAGKIAHVLHDKRDETKAHRVSHQSEPKDMGVL